LIRLDCDAEEENSMDNKEKLANPNPEPTPAPESPKTGNPPLEDEQLEDVAGGKIPSYAFNKYLKDQFYVV
jgi:hypothetical protein